MPNMVKILTSVILISFFSLQLSAQLKGGLKGGLNINDMIITKNTVIEGESYNTMLSYHAGTYIQQTFANNLALQIEILFSNKGYQYKLEDKTTNVSLNYLNWPILLVFIPGKILEFEFGPELGLMVSGEERFNSFDLGLDVGIRAAISKKINAGIRYCLGFPFEMNMDETSEPKDVNKYRNSVLQVYIGFNLINEPAASE